MVTELGEGVLTENKEDKGRFDLIPPKALLRVARRFEFGAKKYDDENWRGGVPLWMFLSSALRHLNQYKDKLNDEDHLAAAVSNILMLMETEEIEKSIDKKEVETNESHIS